MMFTGCMVLEVKGSNHQRYKHGYYVQMENRTCGDKITFRQLPYSNNYIYFWDSDKDWQIAPNNCESPSGIYGTNIRS